MEDQQEQVPAQEPTTEEKLAQALTLIYELAELIHHNVNLGLLHKPAEK